ncbi:MAG: extracellular solute-binding protein [Actinomycetota bacterium]|nr:extracellular solute-binding protein [Actinomycetota bacterium]
MRLRLAIALLAGVAVLASSEMGAAGASRPREPLAVLYAGSLLDLMQNHIDPAFLRATGDTVNGTAGGSNELAHEIAAGTERADVFISASPSVNALLEGPRGGGFVSWYATFATSRLLLAYNPHSRFARALRTRPWWKVVTDHGFLLGRTDPSTDPKGKLALDALAQAARQHHDRALSALARSTQEVFPEQTLVGRLQAGQLDAGFFYGVEAKAAGLPTVALRGIDRSASYTLTVLNRAPDRAAAERFVVFLLGSAGHKLLSANGLQIVRHPRVVGTSAAVPKGVRRLLSLGASG